MGVSRRLLFNKSIILVVIISTFISKLYAQADSSDNAKWVQVPSSVNSDLKFITFFSPQTGVACGKQILLYNKGRWLKYPKQPPATINLFFPVDTNSFFITSDTKYQESDLYYGKEGKWNKIQHPLASNITSMNFTDRENGVIAGLGEIAILKNNRWLWLPPPTNKSIINILIDNNSVIWAQSYEAGLFKYDDKWIKIKGSENLNFVQNFQNSLYILGINLLGIINSNDSISIISTHKDLKKATSFYQQSDNDFTLVGLEGLIMHIKNGKTELIESGVKDNLNAVWMLNDNEGWIAGNDGILLAYSSGEFEEFEMNHWKGFEKITFNSFSKVVDDEYGVVTEDFNNDGLVDIFTCGLYEANHLYINSGNNTFVDKVQQWNVAGEESSNLHVLNLGACAGDFDNDGDNDLYVSALNGRNKIYKNIRGKYFVDYSDISNGTGEENDRTNAAIVGDVDNDGDLDIFITNENSSNRLFLNNSAGIFSEVTETAGLLSNFGGTGCSFGDIDNDNDLDLYITNWSSENILYRNMLNETGQLIFENITQLSHVGGEIYSKSNAIVFSDIDNDADLDMFVTNRKTSNKLYLNNGSGIFTDMTAILINEDSLKSYGAVIADFDGDGFKDIYVSNVGNSVFYKNIEGKKFVDNTLKYGAVLEGYSTGSATADFDNDGDIDVYVANYIGESSAMLLNSQNNLQFIQVLAKGTNNNRSGIGTKIYVYKENITGQTPQLIYYTEISGGSGYASMSQRFLPIPIGGLGFVDVKVVFPMGEKKTLKHVKAGSSIIVEDETGITKTLSLTTQPIILYFKDPHKLLRLLTWICVILILAIAMVQGSKRYKWPLYYSLLFMLLTLSIFYSQFNYFEYRNLWLSTILPVLSIFTLITLLYLYFERTRIKKIAIAEQEKTQKKLSRDLHDDLGSTVSTIGIYLTLVRYNLKPNGDKLNQLLDKTTELVNEAATAITDMVWAVNPKSESLDDLILRVNKNFVTLFIEEGIVFTVTSKTNMEHIMLNYKVKQNIYLIIKEALNNVLKYADALKVKIEIEEQSQEIHLSIKDNGIGFDISALKNKGHGISNMRIRAEEIKARFNIRSAQLQGTEIDVFFNPD